MADPKIVTDARERLGATLASLRQAAGFTQELFAPLTLYGRSTIANVERGRQRVHREFWERCDGILSSSGALTAEHERIEFMRVTHRRSATLSSAISLTPSGDRHSLSMLDPAGLRPIAGDPLRAEQVIAMPPGRYFSGIDLDVRIFPAAADGRILAKVPTGYAADPFLVRSRRGLIIGATPESDGGHLFGLDTRSARRRLAGGAGTRLLMPLAYLLDEITLGLLWAVTNTDNALLDDDRLLHDYQANLEHYESLPRSAASRSSATELAPISAMWLGSDFCARHILRHIDRVNAVPSFWTREQRGEEASAWLLFAHKYQYLERLAGRFTDGMTRTFCVPEQVVTASPPSERILLLLVMALMESFGIRCLVTSEPEYSTVDGFVLDGHRQAIVANWLGAEGIWSVDVTASRTLIREYADAQGYADAHSAIAADSPAHRLQSFADYMALDWSTIIRRCAQLADYGFAGLAEPRSRLLSLAGADRACRYLGDLQHVTR